MLRYLSLLIIIFFGCSPKKEYHKLPFYNAADFTPLWISQDDSGYDDIHKIAEFSFLDQNGNTVNNSSFEGKVYVANFFFTVCPGICPLMTQNMIQLQQRYEDRTEVLFISHTVTPWIDTIEQLKKYAKANRVDDKKYFLVTGDQEDIYKLARTSYFVEKEIGMKVSGDEFLHSENFLLIDQLGRIRGIYNGTSDNDLYRLKEDIDILIKHI